MVGRFENFLRDDVRHHALCCGKGQRIVVSAIFKTFFKNDRIGTRTHAGEEGSQRGSNPRGELRTPLPTPDSMGFAAPGSTNPVAPGMQRISLFTPVAAGFAASAAWIEPTRVVTNPVVYACAVW